MIKFRKQKIKHLFVVQGNHNWNGKAVSFENIDTIIHNVENKKFTVYTKQGKDWCYSDEHYERLLGEYSDWLNNK